MFLRPIWADGTAGATLVREREPNLEEGMKIPGGFKCLIRNRALSSDRVPIKTIQAVVSRAVSTAARIHSINSSRIRKNPASRAIPDRGDSTAAESPLRNKAILAVNRLDLPPTTES